jgi:hypothetical protein
VAGGAADVSYSPGRLSPARDPVGVTVGRGLPNDIRRVLDENVASIGQTPGTGRSPCSPAVTRAGGQPVRRAGHFPAFGSTSRSMPFDPAVTVLASGVVAGSL